ncbi:MAG: hypothetical protein ACR2KT_10325 [Methylocella sp.]
MPEFPWILPCYRQFGKEVSQSSVNTKVRGVRGNPKPARNVAADITGAAAAFGPEFVCQPAVGDFICLTDFCLTMASWQLQLTTAKEGGPLPEGPAFKATSGPALGKFHERHFGAAARILCWCCPRD